jgi:hypothetical protein
MINRVTTKRRGGMVAVAPEEALPTEAEPEKVEV